MQKAKPLGIYLLSLPEKRLTITLEKPNACVHDYAEGEFPMDLVTVGVIIDNQKYIEGFEMTDEVKKELMKIQGGEAVTVTLIADEADADSFPTIEIPAKADGGNTADGSARAA